MICLPICVGSNGPVRFQIPNVALCFLKSSALPSGTPFTSICNSFPAVHSPSSIAFPNSTSQDPAFRPYILAGFAHLHKGTGPPANKPSSLLPNTGIENSWTDRPLFCGRDESCATICGIISGSEDIVGHSVIRDVRHWWTLEGSIPVGSVNVPNSRKFRTCWKLLIPSWEKMVIEVVGERAVQ